MSVEFEEAHQKMLSEVRAESLLRAAATLPQHGHNTWEAPATVSEEEQDFFWKAADAGKYIPEAELREMLGDRADAVQAYADAEYEKHLRGYACMCGCGCTNRYHHATASYCPACRSGCCGEF